ncbi:hypothetical protein [Thermovibrio ammonificans]|uniref:Cytochrome c domain-containing protein n=1 Tax=Thermovibrio ammonificans (strain DSM 15698 / JCM 12110 / HB-1) TaxID=648996 RepID=E8T561_THEA1|nr:hypothetical protein [Thermovibrio ammonificans]ADU96399.1 hypothetical protein Theam_0427 [Thermovibrio ammonificans HB-1]
MKRFLGAMAVVALLAAPASAGVWESQCASCHNGSLAPSAAQLKAKFKTPQAFVKAAQTTSNPMMAAVKGNVAALKAAAKELYGK